MVSSVSVSSAQYVFLTTVITIPPRLDEYGHQAKPITFKKNLP